MNADRLHALLHILKDELSNTSIVSELSSLQEALQQQIQQPNSSNQEQLGEALKTTQEAINRSTVDNLSPAWAEMIREIGFDDCLGKALQSRINESFKRAEVTPTLVKEDIDEIVARLEQLEAAVKDGTSAFETLSIGAERLQPGDCELGFMVPRAAVESRLLDFADECREFDLIFGTFSEIATGSRQHFKIRTVSSSDLSVFLDSTPAVVALIAAATEQIIAVYKQLLEIRKLRSEMLAQDVPKEALESIDEHANSRMGKAIDEITIEVMAKNNWLNNDNGRNNELSNALKISLSKLANRIDKGFHIEVRIGELPAPEEDSEEGQDATADALRENAATIKAATETLQFINLEGDPLLALPEVVTEESAANPTDSTDRPAKSGRSAKGSKKKSAKRKLD